MKKKSILIVINQLFKGGAETALVNLFHVLPREEYQIDLLIFDQIDLNGTLSLIPEIPDWIHVINVAEREKQSAFLKKAFFKLCRRLTGRQFFRREARNCLKGRRYDVAISYGEWFSSALVARYAVARRKYVWVHADMDKASFLDPDILRYQSFFDGFFFASRCSMDAAVVKYPQLAGRTWVVHNQVDRQRLLECSRRSLPLALPEDGLPLVLTVANVREEKNHLRQVEAMKLLFDRGMRFHWMNIGSLANIDLTEKVRQAVKAAGLEDYFYLPGALDNPYAVMCRADAICVLSDHESWSMVITEARQLGVPVIATRTSGALEQITNWEDGILCGFSVREIAESIGAFLADPALGARMRENLKAPALCNDAVEALTPLLSDNRKKALYVFDDLNYLSGARNAALAQLEMTTDSVPAELFSLEVCRDEQLLRKYRVLSMGELRTMRSLSTPIREVLKSRDVPRRSKLLRCVYAVLSRMGQERLIPEMLLRREMTAVFEGYDIVVVVSEGSKLRGFVSGRKHPKKVQWIHTDYAAWREHSAWTKAITKYDAQIYRSYDTIVCLNQTLRRKFIDIYPQFADKTVVIPNLVRREEILQKASQPSEIEVNGSVYNLITIGRFEPEKRYDRLLAIAAELKKRDFQFHWYFVGGGTLFSQIGSLRKKQGLEREVTLTGNLQNPCPLLKQCDLMVLFSEYEGTPVTIDEAKVLGIPVLANDVGGIREQIGDSKYGIIIENIAPVRVAADSILDCFDSGRTYGEKEIIICDQSVL